jgi:predicted acyl esterase
MFITDIQKWQKMEKWLPTTEEYELYLGSKSQLSRDSPKADLPESIFMFDFEDPIPTISTFLFVKMDGGKDNDAELAARSDVVVFTTESLDTDL